MTCLSNCISVLISSCCPFLASTPPSTPIHSTWTKTIYDHNSGLTFCSVTDPKSDAFQSICRMYQLDEQALSAELENMTLWCIYDKTQQPIGAIQLDVYSTLQELEKQVPDYRLAKNLFSSKKFVELSYALTENNRGKGLGSKAVKAFIDHAPHCEWGRHLFAVVSEENHPSIKILEKNGFAYVGNYNHTETKEEIRLYTL